MELLVTRPRRYKYAILPILVAAAAASVATLLWGPRAGPSRGPVAVPSPDGSGPARLVLDTLPPPGPATVLWLEGRATQAAGSGAVRLALDQAGGVLAVDDRLRVTRPPARLGGRTAASVAPAGDDGLWLTDVAGELLRVDRHGRVVSAGPAPFAYPVVAGDPGSGDAWLLRSPERFAYQLEPPDAPLLLQVRQDGRDTARVGRVVRPAHILLTGLANAGHLVVGPDAVFYAPFVRDEIVALDARGDTVWLTRRGLPQTTVEPRFEVREQQVVIDYHPVNLGIARGPDGLLYVLSTPGISTTEGRLDVLDPATGALLRTARLPTPRPTIAVDGSGRVHLLDAARLLHGVPEREREPAPAFDLPTIEGGRLTSGALRGRVALLNFWASWCAPCRTEMPALDSLRRAIADSEFVFVGMNEDDDTDAARGFLQEFGFDFPVTLGRGRLRQRFHYPGLPYTLLLDRRGRIAGRWIGEMDRTELENLRALLRAELDRGPPDAHHHPGG